MKTILIVWLEPDIEFTQNFRNHHNRRIVHDKRIALYFRNFYRPYNVGGATEKGGVQFFFSRLWLVLLAEILIFFFTYSPLVIIYYV